jgi:1-acyl-sn-glycerol-3-phosphate acyltransferase
MLRIFYQFIFWILGWKIEGGFPPELKKYLIAVAPHTSNWDFVIGVMARSIVHIEKAKFLGKDALFRPPFGWIFRWFGGYPVNRSGNHDVTEQVAKYFAEHEEFVLAMAPEGTRKKVTKLRTGFYYIAKKANVPIIPCGFDFSVKKIVISHPFYPTDDIDADMAQLLAFYRTIKGKNREFGID